MFENVKHLMEEEEEGEEHQKKKTDTKKKTVWRATLYLKFEIFFQTFWYQKDEGKLPQKAATFTTN